jgi:hypothetical protein
VARTVEDQRGHPPAASGQGPALVDAPDVDPSFPVMGPWVDIDVAEPTRSLDGTPVSDTRDVHESTYTPAEGAEDEVGPVGAFISQIVELIRGDAYYTFLAVAFVLIIVLGIALYIFGTGS